MRLSWSADDGAEWTLAIRLDPGESVRGVGQGSREVTLLTDRCRVWLPEGTANPSADSLALAAMTIAAPWLRDRVVFDPPISGCMAESLGGYFGLDVTPIDHSLDQRSGSRIGLAYSGGADSIATSSLLPADTPLIHLERRVHKRIPNRATHVRADVQAKLVAQAGKRGRDVVTVGTDLEYIVGPFPMFPEWNAVAVPAILMAEQLDLGGVAFGTNVGSRYLSNGYRYRVPPAKERWTALFEAAQLPFVRPAGGLTEVATTQISNSSDLSDLARSCLLGTLEGPCLSCKKCLRKELISAGLERRQLDPVLMGNLTDNHPAVAELMEPPPYFFQHVVEYGLARARGVDDTFLARAKRALRPSIESTDWTTKYYRPALVNDVPGRFRSTIRERVEASPPLPRHLWGAITHPRPRLA